MAATRVQSFHYQGMRCAPFEWHQRMQKLALAIGLLQPTNRGEAVEKEKEPPNAVELTIPPSATGRGQPEEFRLESEEMQRQAALAKARSDQAKQEHFKMKEIHDQIRASLYAN